MKQIHLGIQRAAGDVESVKLLPAQPEQSVQPASLTTKEHLLVSLDKARLTWLGDKATADRNGHYDPVVVNRYAQSVRRLDVLLETMFELGWSAIEDIAA